MVKNRLNKVRNFLYNTSWGNLVVFLLFFIFVFGISFLASSNSDLFTSNDSKESNGEYEYEDDDCSVLATTLRGSLLTYIPEHAEGDTFFDYDVTASEDIVWAIEQGNANPEIKAILIEVDSGGGSPVAGEEISSAVTKSTKPVIAHIRSVGASSAYWSISGASKIFASKNSDIGSIGVSMSYLENAKKNEQEGLKYIDLSSGKYKDSGSSDRALTNEEKEIFMRDVRIVYENFVNTVSENRGIPIEEMRSFADGSTVLGERAKELGLIDEIGGFFEVRKYLEEIVGEKTEICWY